MFSIYEGGISKTRMADGSHQVVFKTEALKVRYGLTLLALLKRPLRRSEENAEHAGNLCSLGIRAFVHRLRHCASACFGVVLRSNFISFLAKWPPCP